MIASRSPLLAALAVAAVWPFAAAPAEAFCGFYVAKADSRLYNQASKVVLVRDGERTVLTMANDYRGEPEEFALVIPVPTFITREQIHVANPALIDHLDAYSAPRLVEYYDEDPCLLRLYAMREALPAAADAASGGARSKSLGVTVEAAYTVGEYDILILSAKESQGLEAWLREEGYRLPAGASTVLGSYLKQGMRFFVAKVNLEAQARLGYSYLRPLQVAYESRKFMLPLRLGTVNAAGPQELFIFALTRRGRVETTNYRTVRLPTGSDLPLFVEDEFDDFYRAMFTRQVEKEDMRAVFLEYAWDMSWCDPCAAEPLTPAELRELGVFWLGDGRRPEPPGAIVGPGPHPVDVFVTRLHVRYDAAHFPEDLVFQETGDRENFQGRYVLRHPWRGEGGCSEAEAYRRELPARLEERARALADLTGWELTTIRRKMRLAAEPAPAEPWWRRIWGDPP